MGLGSDVAGGPDLSIFTEMRVGFYAQNARRVAGVETGPVLGPLDWLRLGTLDGARALGLDDVIGSLEVGKEADLIAVDPSFVAPLEGQPPDDDPEDLASRLIFRTHPDMVRAAWVRGRRLEGPAADAVADSADLVIVDGTVVDGTGAPGRPGTVVVEGDRLRILDADAPAPRARRRGRSTRPARSSRPGFIDLHSHGGLVILAEPRHEPKVRQGVTTEIVGVDGNGYAPFADRARPGGVRRARLAASTADPDIDYDWLTVADYLRRFDGTVSVNIGTLVGNSPLRIAALGWDDVPADDAAHRPDGAGCSATRWPRAPSASRPVSTTRPAATPRPTSSPRSTRGRGEAGGIYHTHVRYPLGDRFLDPFREAIEIGRRAGAPGPHHPLLSPADASRRPRRAARASSTTPEPQGLDVTFDTYPSEWASTRLLIQLPGWIQAGGPGPLKERLADRSARDRLRAEIGTRRRSSAPDWADVRLGAFRRPDLLRWESRTVTEVMAETGRDAVDVICDLLLAEDLGINQVTSGPWSESLRPFVVHPVGMVGTDSTFIGAKPSPRTYGSVPAHPRPVRARRGAAEPGGGGPQDDRRAGRPPRPARARRICATGLADIVVFDPATVRSNATYDEPRRFPDGIDHVVVNGTLVVDAGEHTGATPGRGIRLGVD